MTVTDIMHVIADLLLMVIVFWYDWRLDELNSNALENEERISKLEQSFDAYLFVEATQRAEDEFTKQLFEKVMRSRNGETDKLTE